MHGYWFGLILGFLLGFGNGAAYGGPVLRSLVKNPFRVKYQIMMQTQWNGEWNDRPERVKDFSEQGERMYFRTKSGAAYHARVWNLATMQRGAGHVLRYVIREV
jgi:hypothetical protein